MSAATAAAAAAAAPKCPDCTSSKCPRSDKDYNDSLLNCSHELVDDVFTRRRDAVVRAALVARSNAKAEEEQTALRAWYHAAFAKRLAEETKLVERIARGDDDDILDVMDADSDCDSLHDLGWFMKLKNTKDAKAVMKAKRKAASSRDGPPKKKVTVAPPVAKKKVAVAPPAVKKTKKGPRYDHDDDDDDCDCDECC
jgi:hypothetical protein